MRKVIELLPYQARLLESKKPYLALIGGTGTGKTWFLPRWLAARMVQYPGHNWIVSSPTYATLKREPWTQVLAFLKEIGLHVDIQKQDLRLYVHETEATIYFISAENPDRMQGTHAKGVIGDEAGLYSEIWWHTAVQRVGLYKGQVLLLTTPYFASGWLKEEVIDPWLAGDKRFHVERPRTIDNPYYPREEIERARQTLPAWRFRMMYEGEFTRPEGLIYEWVPYVDEVPDVSRWRKIRGLDFGFQNPTAIVWLAEDPDTGTWYVYRELKSSGLLIEDIAKVLGEEPQVLTYADPSGKGMIEDLKRRGINIRPARNEVLPGIMSVAEAMRTGRLKVLRSLKHIRAEFESYHWKRDRTGTEIDAPVKENDHLMDALRYAWYTYHGSKASGKVEIMGWSLAR